MATERKKKDTSVSIFDAINNVITRRRKTETAIKRATEGKAPMKRKKKK
jgi:hypothetical protein